MGQWLNSQEEYQRARQVVAELESRIKEGTATPEERRRCEAGADHILIYEWIRQGRWETQQLNGGKQYHELYSQSKGREADGRVSGGAAPVVGRSGAVRTGQRPPRSVVAHLRKAEVQAPAPTPRSTGVVART